MNSASTQAVWVEVNPSKNETTIADAINNWCSSNTNVTIEKIDVYQEHETKYKALIIFSS
jgi:serine protease inhibitor